MSFDTHKTWTFNIYGKKVRLWQVSSGSTIVELSGYKIRLPQDYIGKQLVYPTENITNGLLFTGTAFVEPFVEEALETTIARASGTGISFDPGPAATISDSDDGFSDFAQGDKIRVIGSASNDGDYTLTPSGTVDEDTLTITGTFTTEAVGESITIYQIPKAVTTTSADESSHVNLNRMLSLAVVDYLQSKVAELSGNLPLKDYHMRDFWKKVGDDQSNKRKISMSFSMSPFAIR